MRLTILSFLLAGSLALAACDSAEDTAAKTEPAPQLRSGVYLDALDRDVRPQDDFYAFANGGWLKANDIPDIYSGFTVYHEVRERVEGQLQTLVNEIAASPGAPGTEAQQIGDMFASWMDEAAIEALGLAPIEAEAEAIRALDSLDALVGHMAHLNAIGIGTPFRLSIYENLKSSSEYAAYLNQSGISLPNRDYYLDTDNEKFAAARDGLPDYIAGMLTFMGEENAAEKAAAIYAVEEKIAAIQWSSVDNRDPDKRYNPYAPADLAKLGDSVNWPALADALGIGGEATIIVSQPSYFEGLDRLMGEVSLADWKAYLLYRLINSRSSHLSKAVDDASFAFYGTVLRGTKEQRPRWKRGISLLNRVVGEALGKLYVERHFPPAAKERMEQMVENVIATFDVNLETLQWMTPATRTAAREKLAQFRYKIGYPDVWRDYAGLTITRGDHFGNVTRAIRFERARDLARLGTPVDREEWGMTPQTVNAYYNPTGNEIVFPAARLQPPFFQLDADDAISYGAVGGVIGHEISHGFDDKGSKFAGDGNLRNWWTDEDRAQFEERTSRLVEQFNAFEPVPGMHINGQLTLGENIGDLSGVTMAYRAYVRSLEGQEAPVLDGFTGAQRFFIGYAMSRRGKYREAATVSRLASDPHSPLPWRVRGPYPNIDGFYEAFDLQPGDGYYLKPEDRVSLW